MADFFPKRIAIHGVGLLGASLGLALKQSGFAGTIVGISSEATIATALDIGVIDCGFSHDQLDVAVRDADVLFLCSPIGAIIETIGRLSEMALPDNLVISDVGSTKFAICQSAKSLPANVKFIGGHPMAGSEKTGVSAADPYLFQNAIYALTPDANDTELAGDLALFLSKHCGCKTIILDPEIHDRMTATISHVPHILAVALVEFAAEADAKTPGTLSLAAGGFRDMTRIAASSWKVWKDIYATNTSEVCAQLDKCVSALTEAKSRLVNGSLGEWFDSAATLRRSIHTDAKGFAGRLSFVMVTAPDKPGVIAKIATILGAQNIIINDIEVMKVRENEGGTIRLGFDTAETASRAAAVICDAGFLARERTA